MKPIIILLACLLVFACFCSPVDAQCRLGRCQAAAPELAPAEAPILIAMPDTPRSILKGPILVERQPVRNAVKETACGTRRVVVGLGRAVAFPFRWLRCCGCR